MNDNIIKILRIASYLEEEGLIFQSSQLDKCAESLNLIKQAQYDGIQGYWIRNTRCWQNCYRQKRANNPDQPIQEVWNECHSEYVGSLYGNNDDDWGKYAEGLSDQTKIASSQQKRLVDVQFDKLLDNLLIDGDIEGAISGAIVKQCSSYTDLISEVTTLMLKVADSIKDNDIKRSIELVDVGDSLTKEAQGFLRKLFDTLKGGVSYGKDALGDSRLRGALSRLSNKVVEELYEVNQWTKSYNRTIQETLRSAMEATRSGSERLKSAANETINVLSGEEIKLDTQPAGLALKRLKSLPYYKFRVGFDASGGMEPSDLPIPKSDDSGSVDEVDTGVPGVLEPLDSSLSPSHGNSGEFISENIDVAKDVASKMLQDMNQSENGQKKIQELVSGLGLRLASSYRSVFNLKKESQFADSLEKLERERSMGRTRAKRESLVKQISSRGSEENEMKFDMMLGLAKRNIYRFLTELMNSMGKPQFISFLNEEVVSGDSRGSGGHFRKKFIGTFDDPGGSLDL
tara:strand:- start:75 stop:1619 length:1545 start_codon:yes stop_codon:yes gene_type:complete